MERLSTTILQGAIVLNDLASGTMDALTIKSLMIS
jgi:hypothetical protein